MIDCFLLLHIFQTNSAAMSNRNGLLSQKLCHYLNQGRTIEFALQPQHETSSDSGIHRISGINDFENKSRK